MGGGKGSKGGGGWGYSGPSVFTKLQQPASQSKGAGKGWSSWKEEKPSWKQPWEPPSGPPSVSQVTLTKESQLLDAGYPAQAPALTYEKSAAAFNDAHAILLALVGDISTEVVLQHDADWEVFPEVGDAFKAAGLPEECFAIAMCASQGKWAIGIGGGWKTREPAAKLALAFALAAQRPAEDRIQLAAAFPEFAAMLAEHGLIEQRRGNKRKWPAQSGAQASGGQQFNLPGNQWPELAHAGSDPNALWVAPGNNADPTALWVSLEGSSSQLLVDGFPSEAPVVYHDKDHADIIRDGHFMLEEVLGGSVSSVVFTHDPDWLVLPEVGEAIKQAGGEELCYVVATIPSEGIWAVGAAGGWKPRDAVAKLALCVALLASQSEKAVAAAQKFPAINSFCQALGGPGEASTKHQKVEASGVEPPVPTAGRGQVVENFAGKGMGLPRDSPLWIQIPADKAAPQHLEGLGTDSVALATDSNGHGALYEAADAVLAQLLVSSETDVEYHDDPTRRKFPEVAAALNKRAAGGTEPFQVATCSSSVAWGVGVGQTPEGRKAAAKIGLAAMIVLRSAETGVVPDISAFPAFSDFVGSVQPSL